METKKFNELIAKYWEGTSSLEEEGQLRSYLKSSEGSSKYPEEAGMFGFFNLQREIGTDFNEFPIEKLKAQEDKEDQVSAEEPKVRRIISFANLRNIAAVLLLVLGAYFVWNNNITPPEKDIYARTYVEVEDPKEALEITREALAILSINVDKSERILIQNIAKLSVNNILKK